MKNNSLNHGISLVEVMITVFILGILSAVVVPKFADQVRKSGEDETKTSLAVLRSALLTYFADNVGVDVSTLSAIVPKYIDKIPTAKIGKYHSNADFVVNATTLSAATGKTDLGGWYYVTPSGTIIVNCTHTDTKNQYISRW